MRAGLVMLCVAYLLSQFFRAFLAVLGGVLARDIGATTGDLAIASGLWFIAFAVMQLPVGWALDRVGPRLTACVPLLLGGAGGAALFAAATGPMHVNIAMLLIGIGCSPVLMAAYYIIARQYSVARFATLAAVLMGVGSLGNIVASYPMAWSVETFGWRLSLAGLAALSALAAAGIAVFVRDPARLEDGQRGSFLDLLRMRLLWPVLVMMFAAYFPAAVIRGLWIGPYLGDIFALDTRQVGQATLVMGVAMVAGTLLYGPLDRIFRTQKWVCFTGNVICAALILLLAATVGQSVGLSVALCALIGLTGASFPLVVAHARSFLPPHLTGRGVTLVNLVGIGGAGVMQFGSGPLHAAIAGTRGAEAAYATLFGIFGVTLLAATLVYLRSRDHGA